MLDVLFNAVLIFPSRTVDFLGIHVWIPGAGLQVAGAALGTALAELVVAGLMLWALCVRSSVFRLKKGEDWGIKSECLQKALRLGGPLEMCIRDRSDDSVEVEVRRSDRRLQKL